MKLPHASACVWIGEKDGQERVVPAEQGAESRNLTLVVDVHRQNIPETSFIRAGDTAAFSELLRLMRLREEARHLVELVVPPQREQGQVAGPRGAGCRDKPRRFGDWEEKLCKFVQVCYLSDLSLEYLSTSCRLDRSFRSSRQSRRAPRRGNGRLWRTPACAWRWHCRSWWCGARSRSCWRPLRERKGKGSGGRSGEAWATPVVPARVCCASSRPVFAPSGRAVTPRMTTCGHPFPTSWTVWTAKSQRQGRNLMFHQTHGLRTSVQTWRSSAAWRRPTVS